MLRLENFIHRFSHTGLIQVVAAHTQPKLIFCLILNQHIFAWQNPTMVAGAALECPKGKK
jgi:hypothetical protein